MLVFVYQIKNKINNKSYIGISKNVKSRWCDHIKGDYKSTIHFAIKKYGKENFDFLILEETDHHKLACEREIYWIDKLDTYKNGYNQTLGGDGVWGIEPWNKGKTLPQEIKDKISNSLKDRFVGESNPFHGKKHTQESKNQMSKSCKLAMTDERRQKISVSSTGRSSGMKGKKHTEEAKRKNSLSHLGKPTWNKGIKYTEEQKESLRKKSLKGKDHPGWRKKRSDSVKRKIGDANRGRIFTDEHKDKLAKAKLKLSLDQALDVKQLLKDNHSVNSIAKKFNVSSTVINNIKIGKTYKNI